MKGASKYSAKAVVIDGRRFASTKEGRRYSALKLLIQAGKISALELQPRYPIIVNSVKVCTYVADFRYVEGETPIVEDVKGMKTPMYNLKKKLVKAIYGFDIKET
jgi:hypothetical protein